MLMGRLFPPFYNWFPSTTNVKIYTINSLFILYNNNLHVLVFTSTKLCSDCMSLSVTQGGGGIYCAGTKVNRNSGLGPVQLNNVEPVVTDFFFPWVPLSAAKNGIPAGQSQ